MHNLHSILSPLPAYFGYKATGLPYNHNTVTARFITKAFQKYAPVPQQYLLAVTEQTGVLGGGYTLQFVNVSLYMHTVYKSHK